MQLSSRFSASGIGGLEVLSEDGGLAFCRGWRRTTEGRRSGVLVALPALDQPTPTTLDHIAHEWFLKATLDSTWAVRPLELVRHCGQTILVFEDPGGELLVTRLGTPMEVGRFLRVAVGVAEALGQVHQHGLIHKDIKPSNILVNNASGKVRLKGFGIASRLMRERQSVEPPEFIGGTLAYMAPEQTGRMNRSIDSRSDLYSLGVTLYEMPTGSLPFTASDPMEWVHCHIARQPHTPSERASGIPEVLSSIVMKLIAKTVEERYQTAGGVEADLRRCLTEWQLHGQIEPFAPAAHDTSDRLLIPEHLYGRQHEIATLLASFDRVVAQGAPKLVLVSGYSGVGKSSVVNELHKVLVPPRGLFAAGKFDQYKRDIPYATVAQAFQTLVRQILSKSEAELQAWRDALREALGLNGLLIVDLIPELELVIGKQPPVHDLSPQDAQRRYQAVLRRFIGVFARPEHPLALFLDDLQWLDAATLDLVEDILAQRDIKHLLLIGAYRDNEVDAAHPLMRKLDAIRRAGETVPDIVLASLSNGDLGQLIADSLHCESARAGPLTQLVLEKTGGNPFFAIQFLQALEEEGMLAFDHEGARWSWDLTRIHARRYTDNVVDLMVGKLNRLPPETQAALRQLACVGVGADFALLATVCQTSLDALHDNLWEAVRSGFVLRSKNSYLFQHDRIQEAAYSLIPEASRAESHLQIGRLLLAGSPSDKREANIFEIVSQFNRSTALITSREEREQVAQINLAAGKRSKNAAAYSSALSYFAEGRALLAEDCWTLQYRLAFELELNCAECELLTKEFASAEERLALLASSAANLVDQAAVTCLRVDLYIILLRPERAVVVCLEYLRQVGYEVSPHPTDEEVRQEYERLWRRLGTRPIEDLIDLPLMEDAGTHAIMDVLTKVAPSSQTDKNLNRLLLAYIVKLSMEYGNSAASCLGYVLIGRVLAEDFGSYPAALRFSQLSLNLVDKRGLDAFKARVYVNFGASISHFSQHFRFGRTRLLQAFEEASKIGDLLYFGYCHLHIITNYMASGEPLHEVDRQAMDGLDFARKTGSGFVLALVLGHLCLIRNLRGLPHDFGSFDDEAFDEIDFRRHFEAGQNLSLAACSYWVRRLQSCAFMGDYAAALEASAKATAFPWIFPPVIELADYHFYTALALAGSADTVATVRRDQGMAHLESLAVHHQQLQAWAEHCPENFANRAALVGAEIARMEGRELEAERLYQQAIRSAHEHGFVQNEALAYEVAARFYNARGFETFADTYLRKARDCYRRWGADGKVGQLNRLYPHLAGPDGRHSAASFGSAIQHLDAAAIVKSSQALSGEIELPKLIDLLMTIAIENAGANRGLLMLPSGGEYLVEADARATGNQIEVVLRQEPITGTVCPESVVRYVIRTRESVILDDASKSNLFSADDYLRDQKSKSILCLPLIKQRELAGILFLENALTPHAFTPARIAVLELLAGQAAISLENTRLYGDLREREAKVRRLVDANIIGILIIDLAGEIVEANDAFLGMVGYAREDLLSGRMRWTGLTPPEWRAGDAKHVETVKTTGRLTPFEKEYLRKDGSRVPVLVGVARVEETGNQAVAFVLDLTERKRAEAELAHANRVATMGQLTASIAHEVNQPLAALLANAETAVRWLARQPPNLEKAKPLIDRIIGDGKRAANIVSRIRDFSKKATIRKEDLEVNEAILEIIRLTQAATSEHGVLVKMQLSEGLPQILGDQIQFQQVILNLTMNAIEAMSEVPEGPRVLLISTNKTSDGVLVAISDSGPGLPSAKLDRIFEAFYTTKSSGLGMGLSICRTIIEAHGGRLWATPNEPRGAVFSIMLPTGETRSRT